MKKIVYLCIMSILMCFTPVLAAPHGGHGARPAVTSRGPSMHHSVGVRPVAHHSMHHHSMPPRHVVHYRHIPRPIYRPYGYWYTPYYASYYYSTPPYTIYTTVAPIVQQPVYTQPVVVEDPYATINTTANVVNTAANVASTIKYISK